MDEKLDENKSLWQFTRSFHLCNLSELVFRVLVCRVNVAFGDSWFLWRTHRDHPACNHPRKRSPECRSSFWRRPSFPNDLYFRTSSDRSDLRNTRYIPRAPRISRKKTRRDLDSSDNLHLESYRIVTHKKKTEEKKIVNYARDFSVGLRKRKKTVSEYSITNLLSPASRSSKSSEQWTLARTAKAKNTKNLIVHSQRFKIVHEKQGASLATLSTRGISNWCNRRYQNAATSFLVCRFSILVCHKS